MRIPPALGTVLFSTLFSCTGVVWINDAVLTDTNATDPESPISASDSDPHSDTDDYICLSNGPDTAPITNREINFVVAMDSSGGMEDEVSAVQASLNGFMEKSRTLGMAPRIILISADSTAKSGICLDTPTGGGLCPEDSNAPSYLHINQGVNSKDALTQILATYDRWKDAISPNGLVAFIVISDDESDMAAATFQAESAALAPPITQYVFYAVASSMTKADACALSGEDACCLFAVKEGSVYKDLSAATQGLFEDLCLQDIDGALGRIASDAAEKTCAIQEAVI